MPRPTWDTDGHRHGMDDDDFRDFDRETVDDPVGPSERNKTHSYLKRRPKNNPAIDPLALQRVYNNFQDSKSSKSRTASKVGKSARPDGFLPRTDGTEPDIKKVQGTPEIARRSGVDCGGAKLLILSSRRLYSIPASKDAISLQGYDA
uniref:Uncharacterized protein n=1 Tax=Proboscia inermis TaxID=420281 RepID=A0A7S0GDM6_9STRA|mmetsp:Transcript_28150/g.28541  ORF Transcript_28150/g.28541 Transcript_28150/m.28541 type:complete len:148 (+) Transcript_28150:380-823(+)